MQLSLWSDCRKYLPGQFTIRPHAFTEWLSEGLLISLHRSMPLLTQYLASIFFYSFNYQRHVLCDVEWFLDVSCDFWGRTLAGSTATVCEKDGNLGGWRRRKLPPPLPKNNSKQINKQTIFFFLSHDFCLVKYWNDFHGVRIQGSVCATYEGIWSKFREIIVVTTYILSYAGVIFETCSGWGLGWFCMKAHNSCNILLSHILLLNTQSTMVVNFGWLCFTFILWTSRFFSSWAKNGYEG